MATILVCDDDKDIVEAISIYLEQEGHQILKAYDGQQALLVLQKNEVDLLIIDVMMPKLDGIRATLKIREEHSLPIIILSAKSEDADKILVKCKNILEEYLSEQEDIVSIGVTGQMHGIVYVDENGVAVSPLYTWQDGRGDLVCADIQKKQPVVDSEGMGNIDTESKVADNSEMGDSENIDSGNKVADNAGQP